MAQTGTWVAIVSSVAATVLLVDDLRLRSELDAINRSAIEVERPSPSAAAMESPGRKPATRSAPGRSTQSDARGGSPLEDPEIEARIEDEVAERTAEALNNIAPVPPDDLEDIVEQRLEERMEERRNERRARHREVMTEHIKEFASDAGHSAVVQDQMLQIMDDAMANAMEIRQAIQDGELDRGDARSEFMGIREDVDTSLIELLGEAEAEQFLENVPGPMGR